MAANTIYYQTKKTSAQTTDSVMSLKDLFDSLCAFFRRNDMEFGVIGAFALYSYGYVRATKDVDFITRSRNRSAIVEHLESLGFETVHNSSAFSNHVHPVGNTRVDIMYVEGKTADEILGHLRNRPVFKNESVPVVSVEHLVAMKLFSIQNDPQRKYKDLADVKELLKRTDHDRAVIREYFSRYGQESEYGGVAGGEK